MRTTLLLAFSFLFFQSFGQLDLTLTDTWQITPQGNDSAGVFSRIFFNDIKQKYYVVYSDRSTASGAMTGFAWREYDLNMTATGLNGQLPGFAGGGDFAMLCINSVYYHVTLVGPYSFRISTYNEDFVLQNSVNIPLDSTDSGADMLFNYTNGKLILGAFNEASMYHPNMPTQTPAWNPKMHKWEFDLNLTQLGSDMLVDKVLTTWGASVIYNNNQYNVITMHKWPQFKFSVYRFDDSWNYVDSIALSNDGQWAQGLEWDGTYYYVSYHNGNEHRSGNITVAVYDVNWNLVTSLPITNNPIFDPGAMSPTLGTTQYNANRPWLIKRSDTLFVSYDVDSYVLNSYTMPHLYTESNKWQAYVAKVQLVNTTGLNAVDPLNVQLTPNPSSTAVNVHFTGEEATLQLTTLNGQLISERAIHSGDQIDVSDLAAGVYLVSIQSDNGSTLKRIVKQ